MAEEHSTMSLLLCSVSSTSSPFSSRVRRGLPAACSHIKVLALPTSHFSFFTQPSRGLSLLVAKIGYHCSKQTSNQIMDRFPRRNTARHELEDFDADDDVWVFDPIDADVEMSVNGDDDTSSGDGESDDDASDDDSMSSEDDDSNEDEDDDILERLEQDDPNLTEICLHQEGWWFPTTNAEWLDVGDMLGNNTHITDLSIMNDMDGESISMADERALYAGLQHNRSIEKLHFAGPLPAI